MEKDIYNGQKYYPTMKHLLILHYDSDAERKRIDYAIERWRGRVNVWKPKGVPVILDGDRAELDRFVEDMVSRLECTTESFDSKADIYRLEAADLAVERRTASITYRTTESASSTERFIRYLMAKLGAGFDRTAAGAKLYSAVTRKGHALFTVAIRDVRGETRVTITIEGFGAAIAFLETKLDAEMTAYFGRDMRV